MSDFFLQASAFTVFLAISGVGFLFLVLSFAFGEVFEHFGIDAVDLDHGPSFFSIRVLSVFVTAFGGAGAIAVSSGLGVVPSAGAGILAGLAFSWVIYQFARFLFGQQATTELHAADIVGRTARVLVAIPAGGTGQIRCQVGEEMIDKLARAAGDEALPENAMVRVEQLLGEIAIVRRP